LISLVSCLGIACASVDDVETAKTSAAGAAGTGAKGAGDGKDGGDEGLGGGDSIAQGGASEPAGVCRQGDRSCDGNTPRECDVGGGEWVQEDPCRGATVCTGKGKCSPYRLLDAGIGSFGVRPEAGKIVLKQQTLSVTSRSCGNAAEQTICVTGGIR
jgi:hypothetical protein